MARRFDIRWLIPTLVAVAAVAIATCRSDEPEPAPRVESPTPAAAKPPAPRKSRRGGRTSGAPKTTPGAEGAAESANEGVAEDDRFPFVDVEVVKHDGSPASDAAVVYALRAGTTTTVEPPNVNVEGGRCRLHVLRAGRYDVGAVDDAFAALATDVDVPHDGPLRITLPEPAGVVLSADDSLFPDKTVPRVFAFSAEAAGDDAASFPGRGQQVRWHVGGRLETNTSRVDVVVPKGARGFVRFQARTLATVPGTFTAPATVRVVRAGGYPLTLRIAFEEPGASFPHVAALKADFFVGDVALPTKTWATQLAANQSIGAAVTQPLLLEAAADAPEGTISWKGEGVVAGSQAFSGLAREVANAVDVRLRLDPDAPKVGAGDVLYPPQLAVPTIAVRATGGDEAGLPAQALLFIADATGATASSDALPGADAPLQARDGSWALARRGGWTTDPVRIGTETRAAGAALTLRPGGWLVVAMEKRPPVSLGTVLLRRRDGAPFFTQDGAQVSPSVVATQGDLLGPFPAGDVEFLLELSGEVVGEVRATVKAGAKEKLVVPSLAPR